MRRNRHTIEGSRSPGMHGIDLPMTNRWFPEHTTDRAWNQRLSTTEVYYVDILNWADLSTSPGVAYQSLSVMDT